MPSRRSSPMSRCTRLDLRPKDALLGVFLLLGPTGTGKTRTVEVLAQALHGSEKSLLKVDCGEFQMEHEVAQLIGALPDIWDIAKPSRCSPNKS